MKACQVESGDEFVDFLLDQSENDHECGATRYDHIHVEELALLIPLDALLETFRRLMLKDSLILLGLVSALLGP